MAEINARHPRHVVTVEDPIEYELPHGRSVVEQHLNQEITMTRRAGSFSLEESLAKLVTGGMLERADAMRKTAHPDELESILRTSPS